jgi:phosphonate transport system permease protein
MADIASHRWEKIFRASTKLGMVGVCDIGFELITALRLTAQDQVAAILLIILACVVVLNSLCAILRSWLK